MSKIKILSENNWQTLNIETPDIKKTNDEIISGKRAIAFLDILGFKKMIETMDLKELSQKYENMIDIANAYSKFYANDKGIKEPVNNLFSLIQ